MGARARSTRGRLRAALMASVPGDEASVARGRRAASVPLRRILHARPDRAPTRRRRAETALDELELRGICLFPAMQRYSLHDPRVDGHRRRWRPRIPGTADLRPLRRAVRRRPQEARPAEPLRRAATAIRWISMRSRPTIPHVPFIIPHFGAGLLREALLVADLCPNVYLDTSSSNKWLAYHPGLTLGGRLPSRAGGRWAGSPALRHRFLVFPPRMASGRLRRPGKRAR